MVGSGHVEWTAPTILDTGRVHFIFLWSAILGVCYILELADNWIYMLPYSHKVGEGVGLVQSRRTSYPSGTTTWDIYAHR